MHLEVPPAETHLVVVVVVVTVFVVVVVMCHCRRAVMVVDMRRDEDSHGDDCYPNREEATL